EVGRGGEQLVFVAEVAHHHRRIDPGISGDRPDRGGLEAGAAEPLPGRRQDYRLGLDRRSPHVNNCRPTSVDIATRRAHSRGMPTSVDLPAPERNSPMNDTDVLVVGAGPTGLTVAAALATRGVRVTVVDKLSKGQNTSRAAVVNARTLEVLEDLD